MKKLFFVLLSLNIFLSFPTSATESKWDKESAKFLYEEHKTMFTKKKIESDSEICKFQNELAEVAGEEKYNCLENVRKNSSVDDTSKGDKFVVTTLKTANQMQYLENRINQHEMDIMINHAIQKINTELGL